MNDPDSGAKPSLSGARDADDAGRPKRSRRRKGKQKGATSPSAVSTSAGQAAGSSAPAERPQAANSGINARRNKRRKHGKNPGQENVRPLSPVGQREAPEHEQRQADGRKARRKQRGKRSAARAASPVAEAAVLSPAAGLVAEQRPAHPPSEQRRETPPYRFAERDQHDAPLYAALDLGTNNCRLLIAQPTRPGQFRVVDAFSRIVRLGEGLAASGLLSDDAMDRSVEALKICAAKLKHRNIRRARLIATEACRAAGNGEAFLERVREETGLDLEIINRETEARLAVSGCSSLVGREAKSVVLFDIGGGSSEIAVIRIGDNRSSRLANHITHWTSLPVGVVTLSERHGGRDVTPESFAGMVSEVEGMLANFDCPGDGVHAPEDFHLIGTSGTVTTLAGVHLDLPRYDRRRVDGVWLSDDEVTAMQARLLSWDFTARAANPCIGPDRADLVLAGCAILEAIRKRWPSRRMRVADRGLREGLLTDMMADDGVWRRGRHRRNNRGGHRNPAKPEGQAS
ncbi:Ppx/GppA phosphatase family protein [Shinella zoogloeoides]|uniref:Ppx/GppA phosphatase family protein n=1 Tax=Shinella zoogloeoides TaxID=352475 RepID=UPI00273EC47F|nr:Ppx/GppA phosphatase family protein [Shinella zoogloeoides]WLR93342.1 Ppx/GppA phosphatase family protein [Shinella zoogloeoides]